jgi:hypothetical protein
MIQHRLAGGHRSARLAQPLGHGGGVYRRRSPNHGPTALLWNKKAGRRIEALNLFDKAALLAAIQAPFCEALNKERAERRGEPVAEGSTDPFDACIDPVKEVVILGSADHAHFTRIGIPSRPMKPGPMPKGITTSPCLSPPRCWPP